MKIGLPKLRLSRKLFIITLGITVLLGGTAAAALYFTTEMGGESAENSVGGECTDVQTMVLKTPSNRLWLRRFIRMENASGPARVRTALRIAGLLAKKNAVDLIHVSVLDSHGPTLRSEMRARSIGAEVLIALKPDNLPDMKSPAMASYYEGPVSDEGRYYGDKVVVDIEEIGHMMTAMRSVEEKPDCVTPEKAEDAEATATDHGKKEEHEAKPAEAHGDEPAKEGGEDHATAEAPAKEQSFVDSMLSMVGLGGGEDKATTEPAKDMSHAVAEEPADAAIEDSGKKPASEHEAKTTDHGDESATENPEQTAEDASPVEAKDAASSNEHGKKPAAKAENHSAADANKDIVKEGEEEAAKSQETGDKVEAHAEPVPADEEPAPPVEDGDHADPVKKKADERAETDAPAEH